MQRISWNIPWSRNSIVLSVTNSSCIGRWYSWLIPLRTRIYSRKSLLINHHTCADETAVFVHVNAIHLIRDSFEMQRFAEWIFRDNYSIFTWLLCDEDISWPIGNDTFNTAVYATLILQIDRNIRKLQARISRHKNHVDLCFFNSIWWSYLKMKWSYTKIFPKEWNNVSK